ncbi:DUF3563 family protein [Glaciimonas soli]|nr:DUF3563 family protein [Glaciimonas soli]
MTTLTANSSHQQISVVAAISTFIKRLGHSFEQSNTAHNEAFLAEARDLSDLEHRIRHIDRSNIQNEAWLRGF